MSSNGSHVSAVSDYDQAVAIANDCRVLRDALMGYFDTKNAAMAELAAYVSALAENVVRLRDSLNL